MFNQKNITRILPTKGEIKVTPASQQAIAWAMEKSRVKLQWMPWWNSKSLAAWKVKKGLKGHSRKVLDARFLNVKACLDARSLWKC